MKTRTIVKRLGSLVLTLAMVLMMSVTSLPVYAADGSISIVYNPNVELSRATKFQLYKVADYGHDANGKVTLNLVDGFAGSGVDFGADFGSLVPETDADKQEGSDWHKKWLTAASNLENWIKTPSDGKTIPDPVWTGELAKSESAQSIGSYDNGIYLLIGDEQRVGDRFWSPNAVLIQVLNNDAVFSFNASTTELKMHARDTVFMHQVTKEWQDQGHTAARPESVKVGIFYGSTQLDTVTLNEANNWTYTWYSQEAIEKIYTSKNPKDAEAEGVETTALNPDNNYTIALPEEAASWRVDELSDKNVMKYYSKEIVYPTIENADGEGSGAADGTAAAGENEEEPVGSESIRIVNTFKTAELEITKDLRNYLNLSANANATVVFDVKGYVDGVEEPVYQNSVGMTFKGKGTQTAKLTNLPFALDKLTVEEVYSTNYTVDGDAQRTLTATVGEDGTRKYEVTFVNNYDNDEPPTYSTGIVNVYKGGTYTGKTDTSSQN